jgi:hypothetical protein
MDPDAPVALPPFLADRIKEKPGPEMCRPAQLADELGGLMLTFGDLHGMLGRAVKGEPVTRAEAAAAMSQLCIRAGEAFRRLQ